MPKSELTKSTDYEFAKLIIEACKDSMRRCRWILSGVSIASLAVIGAIWNVYYSWLRSILLQEKWGTPDIVEFAQKRLAETWVESGYLTVPLIGIKVHIADFAFAGSVGLGILTLWLVIALRRQNHLIEKSLKIAKDEHFMFKRYVHYGVSAFHVFTSLKKRDDSVAKLDDDEGGKKFVTVRAAYNFLFFMPAVAMLILITSDILSLFVLHSVFRTNHATVWDSLKNTTDWIRLGSMLLVSIVSLIFCSYGGIKCRRYHVDSAYILKDFADRNLALPCNLSPQTSNNQNS